MNHKNNYENDFKFTYIAPTIEEKREIESIRNSYIEKNQTNTNLEKLRKLDHKVKGIPNVVSLAIGIGGTLLFGLGLTMILEWSMLVIGIIV